MAMVATAVLAASAAITDGTTKVGAETSLAAESSLAAGAIPNLPLTTDCGASKFNRE
jgi:hypothetical protein